MIGRSAKAITKTKSKSGQRGSAIPTKTNQLQRAEVPCLQRHKSKQRALKERAYQIQKIYPINNTKSNNRTARERYPYKEKLTTEG